MANNFDLPGLDALFGPTEDNSTDRVRMIPLADIDPFPGHPFRVDDDEEMQSLVESIILSGILCPVAVREVSGRYQLIGGHRRRRAAELAGLNELPALVREMTDDEATIAMVDDNLRREKILPSERAWAYRMKLEAIRHQGKASRHAVGKESADTVGEQTGDSGRTVQRYIRLTYLISELLQLVDEGAISIAKGVELSYLPEQEQVWQPEIGLTPTPKPAKPKPLKMSYDRVGRFFRDADSKEDIEKTIERALAAWFENGGDVG